MLIGLLMLLQLIQPELDPTWRFVSEYALGIAGFLMTGAFVALAAACVSVVTLYWGQARTVAGRIGVVLAAVSGLGMLIAAVFPTDPITTAPGDATAAGTLHLVGGQLNLTPFAILLITVGLRRASTWRTRLRRVGDRLRQSRVPAQPCHVGPGGSPSVDKRSDCEQEQIMSRSAALTT